MHTYSLSCIFPGFDSHWPVCLVKTRQQKPEKEKEQGEDQSWKDRPDEVTDTEKSY